MGCVSASQWFTKRVPGFYSERLNRYTKDGDFKVYIDGTFEDTKKFRELRNKEPQTKFRQKVLKKEHIDVVKSRTQATMIL